MAYDLNGATDLVTGHNSPLHRGEGDQHVAKENLKTIDAVLEYWLQQGNSLYNIYFVDKKLNPNLPDINRLEVSFGYQSILMFLFVVTH